MTWSRDQLSVNTKTVHFGNILLAQAERALGKRIFTRKTLTEKTKRPFFAASRYLDFLKLPIQHHHKLFNTRIATKFGKSMIKVIIAAGIKTPLKKYVYIFVRCVYVHEMLHPEMNLADYLSIYK